MTQNFNKYSENTYRLLRGLRRTNPEDDPSYANSQRESKPKRRKRLVPVYDLPVLAHCINYGEFLYWKVTGHEIVWLDDVRESSTDREDADTEALENGHDDGDDNDDDDDDDDDDDAKQSRKHGLPESNEEYCIYKKFDSYRKKRVDARRSNAADDRERSTDRENADTEAFENVHDDGDDNDKDDGDKQWRKHGLPETNEDYCIYKKFDSYRKKRDDARISNAADDRERSTDREDADTEALENVHDDGDDNDDVDDDDDAKQARKHGLPETNEEYCIYKKFDSYRKKRDDARRSNAADDRERSTDREDADTEALENVHDDGDDNDDDDDAKQSRKHGLPETNEDYCIYKKFDSYRKKSDNARRSSAAGDSGREKDQRESGEFGQYQGSGEFGQYQDRTYRLLRGLRRTNPEDDLEFTGSQERTKPKRPRRFVPIYDQPVLAHCIRYGEFLQWKVTGHEVIWGDACEERLEESRENVVHDKVQHEVDRSRSSWLDGDPDEISYKMYKKFDTYEIRWDKPKEQPHIEGFGCNKQIAKADIEVKCKEKELKDDNEYLTKVKSKENMQKKGSVPPVAEVKYENGDGIRNNSVYEPMSPTSCFVGREKETIADRMLIAENNDEIDSPTKRTIQLELDEESVINPEVKNNEAVTDAAKTTAVYTVVNETKTAAVDENGHELPGFTTNLESPADVTYEEMGTPECRMVYELAFAEVNNYENVPNLQTVYLCPSAGDIRTSRSESSVSSTAALEHESNIQEDIPEIDEDDDMYMWGVLGVYARGH